MNIMQETFNFVINKCKYQKRSIDDTFFHMKYENEPYLLFELSVSEIKNKFNVLNLSDLLELESNKRNSFKNEHEWLYILYCQNKISKKYEPYQMDLALLFFNNFIKYKKIYGIEYDNIINNYNDIIKKFSLNYANNIFINLQPILLENKDSCKILNWSDDSKIKYSDIEKEYVEAFYLYHEHKYKEAIHKSFSSLESLIKIKLGEKEIDFAESDNFSNNIGKLSNNNFFNNFSVNQYFISLGSIRNKHGGHGKSVPHIENKEFTYFYLHNIGNSLIYISEL